MNEIKKYERDMDIWMRSRPKGKEATYSNSIIWLSKEPISIKAFMEAGMIIKKGGNNKVKMNG